MMFLLMMKIVRLFAFVIAIKYDGMDEFYDLLYLSEHVLSKLRNRLRSGRILDQVPVYMHIWLEYCL